MRRGKDDSDSFLQLWLPQLLNVQRRSAFPHNVSFVLRVAPWPRKCWSSLSAPPTPGWSFQPGVGGVMAAVSS